jgi:hypothetical protein
MLLLYFHMLTCEVFQLLYDPVDQSILTNFHDWYSFTFLQLIYRPDNGEILGVHIFGLHAADLIHEASNAIALGTRIQVCLCISIYGVQCPLEWTYSLSRMIIIRVQLLFLNKLATLFCPSTLCLENASSELIYVHALILTPRL